MKLPGINEGNLSPEDFMRYFVRKYGDVTDEAIATIILSVVLMGNAERVITKLIIDAREAARAYQKLLTQEARKN